MIYLVSYQHSGNTWFRYCIEYITKKPTHGHQIFSISERKDNFLGIDTKAEPIMIKRHEIDLSELNDDDIFILLLREPDQCIKKSQDVNKEFLKYYALIKAYEEFNGTKEVVLFEDIFKRDTIWGIIDKYEIDFDQFRIVEVDNNWFTHQKNCKAIYNNRTKEEGCDLSQVPEILLNHVRKHIHF